jgi:membrane-bound metal-dependent hydrolase YbcI (DUF457 family)
VFVGHALLAFALVAGGASVLWAGASGDPSPRVRRRALALGVLAGAFATLPDVDMLYAPVGLLWADGGPFALARGFWGASTVVHRAATHSLVVGALAAPAFAAWAYDGPGRDRTRALGAAVLVALVAASFAASGVLGGVVVGAFVAGGVAIAALAARHGVGARGVLVAALVGLLSHPFGDLFTGSPPRLLYPFDATLLVGRVALSPDPTLHLLGAMLVELATFWLAALVYLRLTGQRPSDYLDPTAALGLPSGGAALALPAPTLALSYPFVFTMLGVGVACGVLVGALDRLRSRRRHRGLAMALSALATVTLAVLVYLGAYLAT